MKKKIIALFSVLSLLVSAGTFSVFTASAEAPADIVPDWFDADQFSTRSSGDPYGENSHWRFTLKEENGVWTYTNHRSKNTWELGYATSNGTQYKIDLDETPFLKFDVSTTVAEGTDIKLRFNKEDLVDVAFVQGSSSVSVDLSANEDILKFADEENVIKIAGFAFSTSEYYEERSISFSNAVFSAAAGENIKRYEWFEPSCDTKWGQDDWTYSADNDNNRFLINHPSGAKWQLKSRWNATPRADVNTDARLLDIDDFSKLCYDIQWTSKPTDVSLRVIPFVNGTTEGQKIININVGTISQGAQKGVFDLTEITELAEAANENGELEIVGMSFSLNGFNGGNDGRDMINLNDFYFKTEPVTADVRFDAEGTGIVKADAGEKVIVSADAQVAGTEDVTYKWYVDGVLQENESSPQIEILNDKTGMHTVYGVVTAGSGYYRTVRRVSEIYTYGAYIEGNVSMSGGLGAEDMTVMRKYLLDAAEFNELQRLAADVNNDSSINILDLIQLKKLLA